MLDFNGAILSQQKNDEVGFEKGSYMSNNSLIL